MDNLPLLKLKNGKTIYMNGNEITQDEALEIAKSLINTWGNVHPQAKAVMMFEVEPKIFSECPHYNNLIDGLEFEGWIKR